MMKSRKSGRAQIQRFLRDHGKNKSSKTATSKDKRGTASTPGSPGDEKKKADN